MRPRTMWLLVVAAVVIGLGGWYFGLPRRGSPPISVNRRAFIGLADKLAGATEIRLIGKTDLTLRKSGNDWLIVQKSLYPALPKRVHELVAEIAELRLMERRTADPKLYHYLDLDAPGKAEGAATGITVLDAKGKTLAALLVGKTASFASAGGTAPELYVRFPGNNQTWLAQGSLTTNLDPEHWMDQNVSDIKAARIESVVVRHPDQKQGLELRFARAADGKFDLVAPKAHKELRADKLGDVAGGLNYVTMTDVARAAAQPGSPVGDATYRTKGGMVVRVHVTAQGAAPDQKIWAHFAVSGTGKDAAEAKQLAARLDPWAYQLGSWKLSELVPTLADLEVKPPAAKDAAASPAEATH